MDIAKWNARAEWAQAQVVNWESYIGPDSWTERPPREILLEWCTLLCAASRDAGILNGYQRVLTFEMLKNKKLEWAFRTIGRAHDQLAKLIENVLNHLGAPQ